MDLPVAWSPEAIDDLESIADYIARDSEYYARAVVNEMLSSATSLAQLPNRGRVVPEFSDDQLREIFVYSYRLIYRIERERVLVLAVVHGKRLIEDSGDRFD